jgi:hypothetical protein
MDVVLAKGEMIAEIRDHSGSSLTQVALKHKHDTLGERQLEDCRRHVGARG